MARSRIHVNNSSMNLMDSNTPPPPSASISRGVGPSLEEQIAEAYGTPVFIYDADRIAANYHGLRKICSDRAHVFYSLKANPNVSIAAHLRRLGAGAEVSSLTELEIARRAGFRPEDTIFVAPLKTTRELEAAIDAGIAHLVVDSFEELARIDTLGRERGIQVPLLLRINPDFKMNEAPIKMSGVPTQFGFSESDIFTQQERFALKGVSVHGIHVYNGSRVLHAQALATNVQRILDLSTRVAEALGHAPRTVDLGGGWGVPCFKGEAPLDAALLEDLLKPIFATYRQVHPACRIITESGRFLVADAGTLVSRVYAVKASHGEKFAVGDAGYNCFMAAAGLGSVIQRNFPFRQVDTGTAATAPRTGPAAGTHLAGPLCTPGDILARNLPCAELTGGALVALDCAGAYGPSASPVGFIGHGHPAEVLVVADQAHLVRQRDSPADLLRLQRNIFSD